MRLLCLNSATCQPFRPDLTSLLGHVAYEGHATIRAHTYLRLLDVDEDPRMTKWPTTAITRDLLALRPAHRLLVYKLHRGERPWLHSHQHI